MWNVDNKTPFSTFGAFERDKDGREVWCVAVRATFDLQNGPVLTVTDPQEDVRLAPEFADEEASEVSWESDISAFIPDTEVTVRGTIVPGEKAVPVQNLQLAVGKMQKQARLFGPRLAERGMLGWAVADQGAVAPTSLSWRSSFGGVLTGEDDRVTACEENPIGKGIALRARRADIPDAPIELPQIEHAQEDALDQPKSALPVGFGAVSRAWLPRRNFAGTYDEAWQKNRSPLLPVDFDPRFYHSAPQDQVVAGGLKGGEALTLKGFLPDEDISVRLPQIVFLARTQLRTGFEETRFRITRLDVDLDKRQLGLCWVSTVNCNGDDTRIKSSTVTVQQMAGVAQ